MYAAMESYLARFGERLALETASSTSGIVARVPVKLPENTRRRPKAVAIVSTVVESPNAETVA
jgi:hypothetical protein